MLKFKPLSFVLSIFSLICLASCTSTPSGDSGGNTPPEPEPEVEEEIDPPEFLTTLPILSYLTQPSDEKGTVEVFTYKTKIYDINGNGTEEVEKKADVYLPYEYDANKQYNVLYLMHGGGETYTYWLTEQKTTVNVLDNMFALELTKKSIVVAPTFYTGGASGMSSEATDIFQWEFRNDLIPSLEKQYATYCKGDTSPENLIKTRNHRGFAGLSMGSMTSIRSALLGCLDICGYISSMSGGYDASDSTGERGYALIEEALSGKFKDYPIKYWLNQNGTADMALGPHEKLKDLCLNGLGDYLEKGQNFEWIKFPGGAHDYKSWIVGMYNTLLVFFYKVKAQ